MLGVGLDIFRHRYCHKSIDDAVEHAETYVWRDRQPSFSNIPVTLDLVLKSLVVQRAALLCICSIWSIFFLEEGSHIGEAYSSWDRTNVL